MDADCSRSLQSIIFPGAKGLKGFEPFRSGLSLCFCLGPS